MAGTALMFAPSAINKGSHRTNIAIEKRAVSGSNQPEPDAHSYRGTSAVHASFDHLRRSAANPTHPVEPDTGQALNAVLQAATRMIRRRNPEEGVTAALRGGGP